MPGLGRYPCTSCHYVAGNRRMLARHAVLIHSDKVFKCPVCPFITRYAANWYRHKRDLHGLTKITNCEVCGFFANSTTELAQHKESEHPEHLQLEKYEDKYAKEKLRLTRGVEGPSLESLEPVTILEEVVNQLQPEQLDTPKGSNPKEDKEEEGENHDSITFSLPLNGLLESNGEEFSTYGTEDESSPLKVAMSDAGSSSDALGPLKVKRSYNCDRCGLLTSNPREYLYHLRNTHGERISVFECKYCIYASKHVQKLQRHCGLVHRQLIAKDPEYQKQLEAQKEKRTRPGMNRLGVSLPSNVSTENAGYKPSHSSALNKPLRSRVQLPFRCSLCPYQTRNKSFLFHHEKTVHLKKRFYRCLQCGYVTNEKGRYTKHIKYHSLPKMQCEYCFFKTAYKWNMDRHMKNHENGAEGAFRCSACNFTTSTKQSFKSHVTNHHNNSSVEDFIDQGDNDMNGENDESAEWEDLDEMPEQEENHTTPDENISSESYDFPENREDADTVWKDGKVYQKTLQCKMCDFKAAWPFEIKKHEENHKSQKKHPCPLCGMRFEHIAWLTKHLRRVHQENSQAKNIAAAFELLKPSRRRPGKEYAADTVLPMFQEVLKQNNVASSKVQDNPKNSMLSTLLNKPLQPFGPTSVNKISTYKSKALASAVNMSRQLRISNFYEKAPTNDVSNLPSMKSKNVPTCNVCGYKTRWISELQRHMRVHSQEKPFHCPKCKYHCKWKGDLNRHLMKYHGIKVSSTGKKQGIPKLKFRKPSSESNSTNDWQTVDQDTKRGHFTSSTSSRNPDQDGPLDLTIRDTFPNPYATNDSYDPYDFENFSTADKPLADVESMNEDSSGFKSPLQHLREASYNADDSSNHSSTKRKYQCPFCTFGTTTASRFHVHIVQHYNRRPFMCSICNYNSNWEWDITKHIRLKGCRDKYNNKACVLLTDESGRRNYEKYEKYLVDVNEPPPTVFSRPPEAVNIPDMELRYNVSRPPPVEQPNKTCSYDFRSIGSNFEDAPENIVVTPDINIPDTPDVMESQQNFYGNQTDMMENMPERGYDAKCFFCKHCDFKHATKRVVISHLSVHAGIKPFRCRACGIASNWRHVIVRHVKDAHNGYMNEVEDRISYVQEGFALRLTSINSNNQNSGTSNPNSNVPQYGCKICPYKCDKEFYIKFHMKQHRPREGAIYRCDYCPYFVKFKKTLVRHLRLHNPTAADSSVNDNLELEEMDNNIYQNESEMDVQNNDVYDFYEAQVNDSPDDSIAISFDTLNQYSNSESISPQKIKRHICESCPYKTDNKTQYLYHKQFHRPNPSAPFKCTVCTYWATMQHLLTQHMKVHSEAEGESETTSPKEQNFKDIPESFESDSDWTEKMSVVYVKRGELIVKMFKCKFCPMMNKKKANVRVHQKMHGVVVNNGKFACSYCDYQCLNQGGLTNHLKIHQKVPEKEAFVEQKLEGSLSSKTAESNSYAHRKKIVSHFCTKCPALFKSANHLAIHAKFHGSSLPYICTFCDYRARHKPHISQHLTVHSPEYQAKRQAAENAQPPVNNGDSEAPLSADPMLEISDIPIVKKIDQMLLLEASEMNAALKKTGEVANLLQKCLFCPALFSKTSTLTYHISLHGSDGEFKCSQCDYAVNRSSNLTIHSQVHPKKKIPAKPKKLPLKNFPCPSCPAVFYKLDRYERHLNLHGKNYRFACEHCDYSVRFAANLIKHRALHAAPKVDAENSSAAPDNSSPVSTSPSANKPLAENTNLLENEEKKITYICDRCPYFQNRRDAVQSHQRRHWLKDGFKCPYCDYTSMQSGFVQSHIKMHIQPHQLFPAQAFMKYESFKIFCKDDESEEILLFDDQEMLKEKQSETHQESKSKRKRKSEENSEKRKIRKLSVDSSADSNSSDFVSKPKVPVVVLSDILSDKDFKKWAPKLKIPKLKITKCTDSNSSEKIYSKINISYDSEDKLQTTCSKPKPSLVVKISKLENGSKNEKAMYSVSTKTSDTSEHSTNIIIKRTDSVENTIDSVSKTIPDASTQKTDSVVLSVPVDVEEHILMNNSNLNDTGREEEVVTSDVGVENELYESSAPHTSIDESDMKSEESFSSDTVPEIVTDVLCENLSILPDISFEKDMPLTNGESDSHLTNGLGLLPEEIEVKL